MKRIPEFAVLPHGIDGGVRFITFSFHLKIDDDRTRMRFRAPNGVRDVVALADGDAERAV